eukprot:356133-Chlamydomonas_euryale.AAC.28
MPARTTAMPFCEALNIPACPRGANPQACLISEHTLGSAKNARKRKFNREYKTANLSASAGKFDSETVEEKPSGGAPAPTPTALTRCPAALALLLPAGMVLGSMCTCPAGSSTFSRQGPSPSPGFPLSAISNNGATLRAVVPAPVAHSRLQALSARHACLIANAKVNDACNICAMRPALQARPVCRLEKGADEPLRICAQRAHESARGRAGRPAWSLRVLRRVSCVRVGEELCGLTLFCCLRRQRSGQAAPAGVEQQPQTYVWAHAAWRAGRTSRRGAFGARRIGRRRSASRRRTPLPPPLLQQRCGGSGQAAWRACTCAQHTCMGMQRMGAVWHPDGACVGEECGPAAFMPPASGDAAMEEPTRRPWA